MGFARSAKLLLAIWAPLLCVPGALAIRTSLASTSAFVPVTTTRDSVTRR